jgi:hypothetical protein
MVVSEIVEILRTETKTKVIKNKKFTSERVMSIISVHKSWKFKTRTLS